MNTLLLWDIDGTLLASSGAGIRALRIGLHNAFGVDDDLADIDYSGRTDRHIVRQILQKIGRPAAPENFERLLAAYLAALPTELASAPSLVLPGVPALLSAAAKDSSVLQGLLTGNIRRGAEAKLSHHGLWHYFHFGAFADDSESRDELGPHALRRALTLTGREFSGANIWVIGDTPHDIACGRAIGANTLAVATGRHAKAELEAHNPTAILSDLSDPTMFWNLIKTERR